MEEAGQRAELLVRCRAGPSGGINTQSHIGIYWREESSTFGIVCWCPVTLSAAWSWRVDCTLPHERREEWNQSLVRVWHIFTLDASRTGAPSELLVTTNLSFVTYIKHNSPWKYWEVKCRAASPDGEDQRYFGIYFFFWGQRRLQLKSWRHC